MSKKMPGTEVILLILTSCYQQILPPPPHIMWLAYGYGRSRKMSATTPPPPTESARLTAIPENFCYYPPPPNLVGLRRSRKIGPPQKKSWLRRCLCGCPWTILNANVLHTILVEFDQLMRNLFWGHQYIKTF